MNMMTGKYHKPNLNVMSQRSSKDKAVMTKSCWQTVNIKSYIDIVIAIQPTCSFRVDSHL